MPQIPQIAQLSHAKGFAKQWTHKGVAIFMDDTHLQFATDFANIMLASFIDDARRKAAEAAKPKVVLAEG